MSKQKKYDEMSVGEKIAYHYGRLAVLIGGALTISPDARARGVGVPPSEDIAKLRKKADLEEIANSLGLATEKVEDVAKLKKALVGLSDLIHGTEDPSQHVLRTVGNMLGITYKRGTTKDEIVAKINDALEKRGILAVGPGGDEEPDEVEEEEVEEEETEEEPEFSKGDTVYTEDYGEEYPATITKVSGDKFTVKYEDGETGTFTADQLTAIVGDDEEEEEPEEEPEEGEEEIEEEEVEEEDLEEEEEEPEDGEEEEADEEEEVEEEEGDEEDESDEGEESLWNRNLKIAREYVEDGEFDPDEMRSEIENDFLPILRNTDPALKLSPVKTYKKALAADKTPTEKNTKDVYTIFIARFVDETGEVLDFEDEDAIYVPYLGDRGVGVEYLCYGHEIPENKGKDTGTSLFTGQTFEESDEDEGLVPTEDSVDVFDGHETREEWVDSQKKATTRKRSSRKK